MTSLSPEEVRRLYDRIGERQDRHAFYEDPTTERLLELAEVSTARAVFELGCGTGRFARRLLEEHLPAGATYHGVDLSPRMVEIARRRLEPYAPRCRVDLSDGGPPTGEPSTAYDRFVSNFVFDLLSEKAIGATLREAHRMLRPGGRLAICGLSPGAGPISRLVAAAIRRLHAWRPAVVGGCRPVDLAAFLQPSQWDLAARDTIVSWTVPSQVVVARPRSTGGDRTDPDEGRDDR